MKTEIKDNLDNPEQFEKNYRDDKEGFTKAFLEIFPEISMYKISDFWKARLAFDLKNQNYASIRKTDILFLIISCVISEFGYYD